MAPTEKNSILAILDVTPVTQLMTKTQLMQTVGTLVFAAFSPAASYFFQPPAQHCKYIVISSATITFPWPKSVGAKSYFGQFLSSEHHVAVCVRQ